MMRTFEAHTQLNRWRLPLASCAASLMILWSQPAAAFPIGGPTFRDDAPFKGASGVASLTSADGLVTLEAWQDQEATIPANLYQWFWIIGVDDPVSVTDNGAYLDQNEALTLLFDTGVGASQITFLHSGGIGGTANNNLARVNISGFLSDPEAYAATYNQQRIFNLTYANGTVTFDYVWDTGGDYGQLLFANPAASRGQRLKITGAVSPNGNATNYGMGLFRVGCQEVYGRSSLLPVNVRHNVYSSYTTPDGCLTVRGYSDSAATTSAKLGTYVDQCFGVYGGGNNGAIEGAERVTLQFAAGIGLSRIETVYSSGQVTISGFLSDPGFTDLSGNGAFGASYADGVLSFYPFDGGHHIYFFTNRAASAGQTLRIGVDANQGYALGIAGIDYARLPTVIGGDIPSSLAPTATLTTPDGMLTLSAYADTPGTVPANLYVNVDWFGIAGGNNNEAIEGSESLNLQFSGAAGLSALATRYTSGQVVISGFASDPGLVDPSGIAAGVTYADGTLTFAFNAFRAPEYLLRFSNPAASVGRTLTLRTDGAPTSQIALTRIEYAAAPVSLSIVRQGNSVVLTWPTGTLQQSSSVNGTFTDVTGAVSPHTETVSGSGRFYRIKMPQ